MEYRALDVTMISAKDLKDVNLVSKMDVYAVVSLSCDPKTRLKTPVDKDGGTSPIWNFPIKFSIDESLAYQDRTVLTFQLRSQRKIGDRDIGEVYVPIKELLDNQGDERTPKFASYDVTKPDGKVKGVLNISYQFGQPVNGSNSDSEYGEADWPIKGDEPMNVYPAMPALVGASAAAHPSTGPTHAQGATMGLGAGLAGGALGGMILANVVSDLGGGGGGFDGGGGGS